MYIYQSVIRRIPIFIIALIVSTLSQLCTATSFAIPRTEIMSITDSATDRRYEIYIKLPIGYSEKKEYPVVYMTDAMCSFQIVSGATRYPINTGRMDNLMLVGISWEKGNRPDFSRIRDYTPSVGKKWKSATGGASEHLKFIRNDVIAYVEKNYAADPLRRTYIGNSLGGLFGAYVLLTAPETFQNYILGSPSFWYDNEIIFDYESSYSKTHKALRANVYISVGSEEKPELSGGKHDMVEQAQRFYETLAQHDYEGLDIKLDIVASANHATAFPTSAIQGLWWLHKSDGN